jgi:hypothetical protein
VTSPGLLTTTSGMQVVTGGNGTTFVPTKPVGLAVGDLLIAAFYTDATGTVTMPSGFTNRFNVNPSGAMHLRVDWKVADSGDVAATNFTWSWTGSVWRVGCLLRVTGAATTTPFENDTSAQNTTSVAGTNSSLPNAALTGAATVDDLVLLITSITNNNSPTWSAPSTWTLQWNSADDVGIAKQNLASGGAAPSSTHVTVADSNVSPGPGATIVLAIKSPSGGGTTFNLSGSTTQAQSLSIRRAVNATRAISQPQVLALVRGVNLARSVAQTQSLALARAVNLIRSATQAQSVSLTAQKVFLLTRSITQAQALALAKQAQLTRSVGQAQSLALAQAVRRTLATIQAETAILTKQIVLARSTTQTQSLSIASQKVFLLVRSVTQAQAVTLRKAVSLTLNASQTQAVVLRQAIVQTLRVTQPTSALLTQGVRLTRSLTQSQAISLALSFGTHIYRLTVSTQVMTVLLPLVMLHGGTGARTFTMCARSLVFNPCQRAIQFTVGRRS